MAANIEAHNMTATTPLKTVQEQYGSKADLIEKVIALVEAGEGESADEHKRRLRNVSNRKLLHLLAIGEAAKAVGGRDGLVKKVLELKGQSKDHEYADKLKKVPMAKLLDMVSTLSRRAAGKAKKKPMHLRTRIR